ncbi:MAG: GIY-YIG nuclease family protein [Gammaproteobacteria bacterium]|nr:GIY-YIG nuclease family protein [Gammaproteobacteria bacterium]
MSKSESSHWYIYIVHCADQTYYTGLCRDVQRRVDEHNMDDKKGARYTRARRPVKLVYMEKHSTRSAAAKREAEIKKLSHLQKRRLCTETNQCDA